MLLRAANSNPADTSDDPPAASEPAGPVSVAAGLFGAFTATTSKNTQGVTIHQEVSQVLSLTRSACNCLSWWDRNPYHLTKLKVVALRMLTAPASSAPIERVFSQSGLILRQHRASMDDTTLSKLLFLKCNSLRKKTPASTTVVEAGV